MRRFAAVIALAACSTKAPTDLTERSGDPAPQSAAPITGRHSALIELVAVADDGRAAITQDRRGSSRLWPTLDGTREPVVVQLPFASSLALGATKAGFVVAALDESGGAQIVELDALGRVRNRTDLAPDPEITQLAIQAGNVLALRADQTLSMFAPSGALLARLQPPDGRRIERVATRNGRALAVLDRNALWIEGTAWGKPVDVSFHESPAIAGAELSPDGAMLALQIGDAIIVYSLLSGESLQDSVGGGSILDFAFADNATLAIHRSGDFEWRPLNGGELRMQAKTVASDADGSAWANGVLVRAAGHSLELRGPEHTLYLGYANETMPLPIDVTGIPPDARALVDVQRIDARYVLATHHDSTSGWNGLSVVDTETQTSVQSLSAVVENSEQRYEPTTHLLAVTDRNASFLVRYEDATHTFATWYRIEYEPSDLYVVDPARAKGVVALAIRTDDAHTRVRAERFYAKDLVIGAAISSRETHAYTGRFLGVDSHDRVYVADGTDLVAFDGPTQVMRVRGAITGTSGRLLEMPVGLVVLDGENLALYDRNGSQRWRVPTAARDITRRDAIYGFFQAGMGRFDLATGALLKLSCGTGFGFIAAPPEAPADEDTICDAP